MTPKVKIMGSAFLLSPTIGVATMHQLRASKTQGYDIYYATLHRGSAAASYVSDVEAYFNILYPPPERVYVGLASDNPFHKVKAVWREDVTGLDDGVPNLDPTFTTIEVKVEENTDFCMFELYDTEHFFLLPSARIRILT